MLRNDYLDAPAASGYLAHQHVERYHFAAQVLQPGMRVLDIASGSGYGSAILTQAGCKVIAADLGRDQLLQARAVHGIQRLVWANALRLPLQDGQLDAVVTFETIEHVVDGRAYLEEMRRVLKPGGLLVCSTPNIDYTAHPVFHLKEYAVEEFYELVEQVFPGAERYVQYYTAQDHQHELDKRRFTGVKRLIIRSPLAPLIRPLYHRFKGRRAAASPAVSRSLKPQPDSPYRVHAWTPGADLIRIMVVTVRKA